jgi:hypothetical protein
MPCKYEDAPMKYIEDGEVNSLIDNLANRMYDNKTNKLHFMKELSKETTESENENFLIIGMVQMTPIPKGTDLKDSDLEIINARLKQLNKDWFGE